MTIAVVGGDLRQIYLARLLKKDGHDVKTYALEKGEDSGFPSADIYALPIPLCGEGGVLNAVFSEKKISAASFTDGIPSGKTLIAGKIPESIAKNARERGIKVVDLLEREDFAVRNAVATAEGAVQLAMEELPVTIHGLDALILGFGRVGRVTALKLRALGASVTVAARSASDRAWAEALGCRAVSLGSMSKKLWDCGLVINTIPAPVLGERELTALGGALVLDLASKPGGVDFETAKTLGVRVIWALSLPGRVAPQSAAEVIMKTLYEVALYG